MTLQNAKNPCFASRSSLGRHPSNGFASRMISTSHERSLCLRTSVSVSSSMGFLFIFVVFFGCKDKLRVRQNVALYMWLYYRLLILCFFAISLPIRSISDALSRHQPRRCRPHRPLIHCGAGDPKLQILHW